MRVIWQGADVDMPDHVAPSLAAALSSAAFVVRDLPGDIDDESRIVLVRRLLREGLLRPE